MNGVRPPDVISCRCTADQRRCFEDYARRGGVDSAQLIFLLVQAVSDPEAVPSEVRSDLRSSARLLMGAITDTVMDLDRALRRSVQDRLRLFRSLDFAVLESPT